MRWKITFRWTSEENALRGREVDGTTQGPYSTPGLGIKGAEPSDWTIRNVLIVG
jgi:hypothetical protein